MPLASTTRRTVDDREDISLIMMDGENTVRVEVRRKLLVAIGGVGRNNPDQHMATLDRHRDQVERIASAKYDEGDYQRYANGSVVPITPADWERYKGK